MNTREVGPGDLAWKNKYIFSNQTLLLSILIVFFLLKSDYNRKIFKMQKEKSIVI